MFYSLKENFKTYWSLIKSLQTGLLLLTGLAGYMSCRCPILNPWTVIGLTISLGLTISGTTVLNMWYDRDIDAVMKRTCWRPLPTGLVTPSEAIRFGSALTIIGVAIALAMDGLYGIVVFSGFLLDFVIYTIWLKRRTSWSIIWGGISGGIPVLAGRVLGSGGFDWVGFAFLLAILFWIPTHILTFTMKYADDYRLAKIPTLPSKYGFSFTRKTIALSSVLAALFMGASAFGISLSWGYLRLLAVLALCLLGLAFLSVIRPSPKLNFSLFKFASLFMLGSMVMIVLDVI
jgi:protoheme IX farnesyltransferase